MSKVAKLEVCIDCSRASTAFSGSFTFATYTGRVCSYDVPTVADVFISSIQDGFEDVRAAARAGVETYGHRAVMAETSGAAAASPQRALLDRVAAADIFLLLVGPRYGMRQASGLSATEEEFEEARRRGKPILVLVQEGESEPEQEAFVARATGGWEVGIFRDSFRDASDAGLTVVGALRNLDERGVRAELEPTAVARAQELAAGTRRDEYGQGGASARVILVPLLNHRLLDAVALDDRELPDELASAARAARLVPQSQGITPRVTAAGITLEVGERHSASLTLSAGPNGEVVAEASVAGDDQNFGSMRIVPERLEAAIRGAMAFAESVWLRVDPRGEVQEVAVTVAIPQAQHKSWGRGRGENAISMGGMFSMPETAIAPQPARVLRRADLARDETITGLVAEMRRIFVDAGAVDEG
ncbi:hypothetical protein BH18ACT13_BH18ACT13_08070 [soil metagenome]